MKTLIKTLTLFIVTVVLLSSCSILQRSSGDGFQGIVKYDITYESDELSAADRAQLPTEVVVYIADNKVRNDQISPMYSISSISDFNDGSTLMLLDAMGQKIAVEQSKEDTEEAMAELEAPEIRIVEEFKEIKGYRSQKAEVTMNGDIVEVFFTEELDVPEKMNDMSGFKGIKGLLMEYSIIQGEMIMTMTVKEINSTRVRPHMFKIPDGYEIKTPEELGGMFGM